MDCSWLIESDDAGDETGSESDPEEAQAELETRLYSIVHHSDLSQPLPPELAKHYSVQCADDGKLIVELKDSLEEIKSDESKHVNHLVNNSEPDGEIPEVEEIRDLSERDDIRLPSEKHGVQETPFRRFRYSDVNLDLSSEPKTNGEIDSVPPNINYFKITPSFYNKKPARKLKGLVIPSTQNKRDNKRDWKALANESFISVGLGHLGGEDEIIEQMVLALREVNPNENSGKLYRLARMLYSHNRKRYNKSQRRKKARARVIDSTFDSSIETNSDVILMEINESFTKSVEDTGKNNVNRLRGSVSSLTKPVEDTGRNNVNRLRGSVSSLTNPVEDTGRNNVNRLRGSVSLNISPFKPSLPTVDLVSEDEIDNSVKNTQITTIKWKQLADCHVPIKWSKAMTKFYTKPSRRQMEINLNDIFEDMKQTTTKNDWKLDPRDETGKYHRTPLTGRHKNRRCPNCNHIGHLMQDCPSPRKISSCFLCGQTHHTTFFCPNQICSKCGVYLTNDTYECNTCYYNTFHYDTPCGVCGQVTHRSEICPDLWRSFHATTEGDKKIPERVVENKRKYCCNCANKGHFSHNCPFPSSAEKLSSFVSNYSASTCDNGTAEIVVPQRFSDIVDNADTDRFLQRLSNSTKASIVVEEKQRDFVFKITGTFEQCRKVKSEIEYYVNTKKRKRQEPMFQKKKRRMM